MLSKVSLKNFKLGGACPVLESALEFVKQNFTVYNLIVFLIKTLYVTFLITVNTYTSTYGQKSQADM